MTMPIYTIDPVSKGLCAPPPCHILAPWPRTAIFSPILWGWPAMGPAKVPVMARITAMTRAMAPGVATRTRARTKQPTPYRVLMLNDDYTPMEFVVLCLQRFFRMSMDDATRVMLHVHQRGVGVCGVFSYEVAETKVAQVIDFARANQHPLQCTLEKGVATAVNASGTGR